MSATARNADTRQLEALRDAATEQLKQHGITEVSLVFASVETLCDLAIASLRAGQPQAEAQPARCAGFVCGGNDWKHEETGVRDIHEAGDPICAVPTECVCANCGLGYAACMASRGQHAELTDAQVDTIIDALNTEDMGAFRVHETRFADLLSAVVAACGGDFGTDAPARHAAVEALQDFVDAHVEDGDPACGGQSAPQPQPAAVPEVLGEVERLRADETNWHFDRAALVAERSECNREKARADAAEALAERYRLATLRLDAELAARRSRDAVTAGDTVKTGGSVGPAEDCS